jgi:methionine-S-sulfoxide reductase
MKIRLSTSFSSLLLGAAMLPLSAPSVAAGDTAEAVFAGGCFWCMEGPFDQLDGVKSTTSGYIGGQLENPTYKQVSAGSSGHTEALKVVYDPGKVSYDKLLEVFWVNIDPTDAGGQFCDRGSQYRSGIFYADDAQKAAAEASLVKLENDKPFKPAVVTEIT